jgi:beta-carotene ketolase (CrtO type)
VGGGHNGLVCAAYLARAGLDVCVLEKNDRCGGTLFSTVRSGITLEHGAIDHSTIVASTIPKELELERHGLRYLHRTASAMHLFGDGVQIAIAETAEETARSIAEVDEADAESWMELTRLAERMLTLTGELSNGRAVPMSVITPLARAVLGKAGRPILDLATMPVLDIAERWFRSPHMRALAVFRSQFSGLPAWYPGTGAVFGLTPAGHGRLYSRPEGGSRAFIESLRNAITASGGRIRCDHRVSGVKRHADGWQVETTTGGDILATLAVVSAIPPQDMILKLIGPAAAVPAALRRRLQGVEVVSGNLSQFTIAAALRARPPMDQLDGTGFEGSQLWLLSEPGAVLASQAAALTGEIAEKPGVLVTFPSIIDPSAAPGAGSVWINGFLARRLSRPGGWAVAVPDATERIWSTVDSCLPGVRELVSDSVFTTPDDLTERTAAENPGFHVAATLHQLFGGRPARGCANHRSGIDGIYLTGAGTNPGPSVSGLPGRACAQALLTDMRAKVPGGRVRATWTAIGQEWARARTMTALVRDIRRTASGVD